jgi:ABC-2 type transport system ATP-binding protein
MDILEVKNLTKTFGLTSNKFTAVDTISFSLKEGEILGFLGPNGAGKTTTIQMLLGVLNPTSGNVQYFGKDFKKNRENILEQVNFSSTYTNLPWLLSVEECLTFLSYLYKIDNRKKRIEKIVSIFKLEKLLKQQIMELSAGQLTRVNLAKAFLNYPKVLLLDEPTASLDPDIAAYIRKFLLEQRKEFATSIIITSHNMSEVEEICDRVIFINHGKIIANDTPEKLAKTIETCHVELQIKDGLKRIEEYCKAEKLAYKIENRFIVIDVKELEIPNFLQDIMKKGIEYTEISIAKPTLEDFFLQASMTKKEKAES